MSTLLFVKYRRCLHPYIVLRQSSIFAVCLESTGRSIIDFHAIDSHTGCSSSKVITETITDSIECKFRNVSTTRAESCSVYGIRLQYTVLDSTVIALFASGVTTGTI